MGYDYQIQYRSSANNQAAYALSRLLKRNTSPLLTLSVPYLTFMEELYR